MATVKSTPTFYSSMDTNCCAECGFTTQSIGEFEKHVVAHEDKPAKLPVTAMSLMHEEADAERTGSPVDEDENGASFSTSPLPPPSMEIDDDIATRTILESAHVKALTIDGLLNGSITKTEASEEEKMICSSSSSDGSSGSGSVSPSEGTVTSVISKHCSQLMNLPLSISPPAKKGKAQHVCPHCNFTTYMSQHMKSHLEAHERHQGQMYQCDICQMQFSQKANMHRHRMRHSGVKPYECRYCKKRFFRKDQMQEHSMTHIKTGADFDCPVSGCTQQFSQHSSLRAHLDEAHTISSSSPASCKRCSLLFANSRRLLLHYQTKHDEGDTSNVSVSSGYSDSDLPPSPPKKRRHNTSVSSAAPSPRPDIPSVSMASSLFMPASPALPSTSHNNNHLALLQSLNAFHSLHSSMEAVSPLVGLPIASQLALFHQQQAQQQAVAALASQSAKAVEEEERKVSVDFDPSSYSLTSEELLLALSNSATNTISFLQNVKKEPESSLSLWSGEQLSAFTATTDDDASHSPSAESHESVGNEPVHDIVPEEPSKCDHCNMIFLDKTLYLVHKQLHSDMDPWTCKLCNVPCGDLYRFTTHLISASHSFE